MGDYRTYWTGILAPSVTVVAHKETPVQQIQYVNSDTLFGFGQTTTTTTAERKTNPTKQEKTSEETRRTTKLSSQSTSTTRRSTTRRTTKATTIRISTRQTTKLTTAETTTTKQTTKSSTEAKVSRATTVAATTIPFSILATTAATTSTSRRTVLKTVTSEEDMAMSDVTSVSMDLEYTTSEDDPLSEPPSIATEFPIDFKHANGTNLFGNDEGRNDSLYQPPRSGRRNDEEAAYQNLEAEYGSWKSVAAPHRTLHTLITLLSGTITYLFLFCVT